MSIKNHISKENIRISVVIPTCDRPQPLQLLLADLDKSRLPLMEVIVVDSGEKILEASVYAPFSNLSVVYLRSERSVCIQRNTGIRAASGEWIFLCDDDIGVPVDYLQKINEHIQLHPEAGAVSGLVLQQESNDWKSTYPVRSTSQLVWKFIFQQTIWGEIECERKNAITKRIGKFYRRKGNHISKAGWPVITDFSGEYFACPVYGLGASIVRKQWLMDSLYSEVLDRHGIGDNYGVAMNFPGKIHVLTGAWVYHYQEPVNRLQRPTQYFRRVLALDYFASMNGRPNYIRKSWLLWSLAGNLLEFLFVRDRMMIKPVVKAIWVIASGKNPYRKGARQNKKIVEPVI